MAKLPKGIKRTLSNDKPRLKVNFKELTGVSLDSFPSLREQIAQRMIDRIRERSEDQKSWTGSKFPKYSKMYKDSDEYKAFGKTGEVNLKLTGAMMNLLDVVDQNGDVMELGWDEEEESAKAHGHITGSVGKKRDFFGFNSSEVKGILKDFDRDIRVAKEGQAEVRSSLEDRILGFISQLGRDGNGES